MLPLAELEGGLAQSVEDAARSFSTAGAALYADGLSHGRCGASRRRRPSR